MRVTSSLLALGYLLLSSANAQNAATGTGATSSTNETTTLAAELLNLEHYFNYGRSPAFYPTPEGTGLGDWAAAYTKAKALVAQMTNEEKETITIGYASTANGCSGVSGNVTRLGYPGMCLNDAGNGVRGVEGTSGYPSGLHVGASWNKNLAKARAQYMGAEFKAKGVTVALGPVVAPLGRIALGGRNWEGFSSDPWLSGSLTSETVTGLQESVIACTKHFIAYEQETNRNPTTNLLNASVSSNLDDKTMHEVYLWPFVDAVKAGTGSIMCSYNRINGSYACQNSATQNGLLKSELEFQGFIVSDWDAQHTGIASANAGLDMAMPNSVYWSGNLTLAVNNGTMNASRLDDMATRIVATWYKYNPLPNPGHGIPYNLSAPHAFTNARNPASKETIFQGAVEGHVLVKNEGSLPLKKPELLSLFGYDAMAPHKNDITSGTDEWAFADESLNITPAEAVISIIGEDQFANNTNTPGAAYNGTIISGGGSGSVTPAYINAPWDAIQDQAYTDNTYLFWDFVSQDPVVDPASDACLVFINEWAAEGYDRPSLADAWSDKLVLNVAAQCNNTIVSIHNAGIRIVDAFIDHPNVTAVIFSHLPGQDSGRALVELLYGRQSPSGRLPYTVGHKESDYGSLLEPVDPSATSDYYTQANFTEGVYIDYKSFIARNVTPRYAFGYGLTYSNFSYTDLHISSVSSSHATFPSANATATPGGNPSLWDTIATVTAKITNTGHVEAAEVAQLYVGIPGAPLRQLRGYVKESLAPGAGCTVTFALTRRDLSVWDVVAQDWELQTGSYSVEVGKSVLDIQLSGSLAV